MITNHVLSRQTANAIYDSGNYMDVFERDIVEAEKEIIVSSPALTQDKTERFIYLVKSRQEAGITVTVITMEPQNICYGSSEFYQRLIQSMRERGWRKLFSRSPFSSYSSLASGKLGASLSSSKSEISH